jgi:hypothetical protein
MRTFSSRELSMQNFLHTDYHERSHDDDFDVTLDDISPFLCGSDVQNDEIINRMLRARPVYSSEGAHKSFVSYMNEFRGMSPDLFVFTANSAVPLADSVRGFYEFYSESTPSLTYIHANRQLSRDYSLLRRAERELIESEIDRLKTSFVGSRTVVFDQFVYTGGTLRRAESMLAKAGLKLCGATIGAQWYEQVHGGVDLDNMTSPYAPFMRRIGEEAAYNAERSTGSG